METPSVDWNVNNLEDLLSNIWRRLQQGAAGRHDPWHTAALATISAGQPATRTVVLRAVDIPARTLMFFSDARANKIQQILERPRVEWLFYDSFQRVQLRARAGAVVHHLNPITEAVWRSRPDLNYLHYLSLLPPGTSLPASLPSEEEALPEDEFAYRNFAVVVTTLDQLDWLRLLDTGHTRALFTWDLDHFSGRWMVA